MTATQNYNLTVKNLSISKITTIASPFNKAINDSLNQLTKVEVTCSFGYNINPKVNNLTAAAFANDITNEYSSISIHRYRSIYPL